MHILHRLRANLDMDNVATEFQGLEINDGFLSYDDVPEQMVKLEPAVNQTSVPSLQFTACERFSSLSSPFY